MRPGRAGAASRYTKLTGFLLLDADINKGAIMPLLRFEGYSDDTFGEVAHFKDDYDCCASGALIAYEIKFGDNGLIVTGQYDGDTWPKGMPGVWTVGVAPLKEDTRLPDWPIQFCLAECGYSAALMLDAPDGVTIRCLNRGKESAED